MDILADSVFIRPLISQFTDPVDYVKAMIDFLKKSDPSFSVYSATKNLRRISPSLVTLILKRKRKITFDRVEELTKLLRLNAQEKNYFRNWIDRKERGTADENIAPPKITGQQRRETTAHILTDWLNLYVKDLFQIPEVQKNPDLIYQHLSTTANKKRVDRAIEFLLREGYLRKTLDGKIVIETNLTVTDPKLPSQKIRNFHKAALQIAKSSMDLYTPQERFANTLILPLNEESYRGLQNLIEEFAEKLKDFAEQNQDVGDRLYQLIINLSPTGGKAE